jgi:DNA-binding MarR family transcriptional regulator
MTPSQLMQETMVTSGTMTNRLDRLEELNLITRLPDPNDGRGSLVTLTALGMKKVDEALDQLIKYERTFLTDLSDEEFKELANLLSKLAANFDTEES